MDSSSLVHIVAAILRKINTRVIDCVNAADIGVFYARECTSVNEDKICTKNKQLSHNRYILCTRNGTSGILELLIHLRNTVNNYSIL